jgi:hypothetical protein
MINNALLEQLDANGMPTNAIRNNLTGALTRIQSTNTGPKVNLDYSRPMIQLAGGKKGYYGKDDPMAVYDAEGNKLAQFDSRSTEQIYRDQDRAYQMQKRQMDLQTEALQQKKMQQELSNAGRAPVGYRYTADGNGMEVIPGGPADLKAQALDANKAAGAADVDLAVGTLRDAYDRLDQGGGITNTNKGTLDNIVAGASSSAPGQMVGKMLGTKNQSARNEIEMTRPALLAALMKATGMSAKQMDSNAELKLWMRTATDPTLDIQANRAALSKIEQKYLRGAQPQQQGGAQVISEARNAIMGGAPREAVIQRLESMGITNHGL